MQAYLLQFNRFPRDNQELPAKANRFEAERPRKESHAAIVGLLCICYSDRFARHVKENERHANYCVHRRALESLATRTVRSNLGMVFASTLRLVTIGASFGRSVWNGQGPKRGGNFGR
jgi:hypothetical protein